jgi:hypothetical protein
MSATMTTGLDMLNLTENQVLMGMAGRVGELHAAGDREEFLDTLCRWGMPPEEAEAYWGNLLTSSGDPDTAKDNTEMALALGIAVKNDGTPFVRNHLLYRMVELQFPDMLQIEVRGTQHIGGKQGSRDPKAKRLHFGNPPFDARGNTMKVIRLLRGEKPTQFDQAVVRKAAPVTTLLGGDLGLRLVQLLVELKMLIPDAPVLELLAPALKRGLAGETLTLVGAFCPDYAYEETGNPGIPYRYTFDGVGDGVGLVARQFVRVMPPLSRFLTDAGIPHRLVLSIGDFEADSEEMLRRVGVGREEFLARCRRSLTAFHDAVGGMEMELEMFDEVRGKGRLRPYGNEATARMIIGDFGRMPELYPHLEQVISMVGKQYKAFYGRWYGRDFTDREVTELVLQQGGEYASVARIYAEDFGKNTIIIAGDRPQMHLFNAFFTPLPVLCVKRAY